MTKKKPDTVTITFRVPLAIRERMEQIVEKEHRTMSVQSFLFFMNGFEAYERTHQAQEQPAD